MDYESAKTRILETVAAGLRTTPDRIDARRSFTDIGLDSLDAIHLLATIESIIGRELPEDYIKRATCLNDVFEMIRTQIAAA